MSYESVSGTFESVFPRPVIQDDEQACLSACLLSQLTPDTDITEADITQLLTDDNLFSAGIGTGLYPARVLDESIRQIGLSAGPVFEARASTVNETPRIAERLVRVHAALDNGDKVLVAFPKRRQGEEAFLHYAVLARIEVPDDQYATVIMDPSEIDGGVFRSNQAELALYVTPEPDVPVMAWSLSERAHTSMPLMPIMAKVGRVGLGLLDEPLYREQDTGKAIPPDTEHPCSVVVPTAEITEQFAAIGDIVLSRDGEHPFGYPRFIAPPAVRELAMKVTGQFDNLPFPSRSAAQASAGLEDAYGDGVAITEDQGLFWVPGTKLTPFGWQHTGLGISSRQAAATLEGRAGNDVNRRSVAEQTIKQTIENHTGARQEDIYLFPTGMAGIYHLNQALITMSGGKPGVQFGFPYSDSFEQRKFGPELIVSKNIVDLRDGNYDRLQQIVDSGQEIRSVFTEYPSNPLLVTPDFERLDTIVGGRVPIIVDDTIGTMVNLDGAKLPSSVAARVTSLTKFFSSTGDVMGGSIILQPGSPYYDQLKAAIDATYEDTVWHEDAEVLARNGQQLAKVMPVINQNGAELAGWLDEAWTGPDTALQQVYYPGLGNTDSYDKVRKNDGGYGGLMTLRFNDPEKAYGFFDELRITKGPSLGTLYTLGCLYTRLAHKPLNAVKKFGVTPDLVRISAGIEDIDDLRGRFDEALRRTQG